MRTVEVVLGGETYTVTELPVRQNAAWRKQLGEPFGELLNVLQHTPQTELSKPSDVAELVRSLSGLLLGSLDLVADLLFAYAPALAAQRAVIEEHAYESEILEAFASVLTLAFPFGVLGGRLQTVAQLMGEAGSANKATGTNSPARPGGSGVTK